LWNLALLAQRENKPREAEEMFARLVASYPDWEDAAFRLGHLQLERGDFAAAAKSFELCLKKNGSWIEALVNLAAAKWSSGELEAAGEAYHRVLAIDPKHVEAQRALAAVLIQRKDAAAARKIYSELATAGNATPELAFNLGLLLQSGGDHAGAAGCFRDAAAVKATGANNASAPAGIPQPLVRHALINLGHALKASGRERDAREAWSRITVAGN
jgi:tetratricopeptide (TPR) repeat protein